MVNDPAVLAGGLRKRYGRPPRGRHYPMQDRGVALAGLDLCVAAGNVHAVLGPNGAGKTTAVRILTTLLRDTTRDVPVPGAAAPGVPAGSATGPTRSRTSEMPDLRDPAGTPSRIPQEPRDREAMDGVLIREVREDLVSA